MYTPLEGLWRNASYGKKVHQTVFPGNFFGKLFGPKELAWAVVGKYDGKLVGCCRPAGRGDGGAGTVAGGGGDGDGANVAGGGGGADADVGGGDVDAGPADGVGVDGDGARSHWSFLSTADGRFF